jgi:hypothetical protein
MKNSYRRRLPASRLERQLARLLSSRLRVPNADARVDLSHAFEVQFPYTPRHNRTP